MSRVIKSAIWQEKPKIVERPVFPKAPGPEEEIETAASFEAQMVLLQEKEAKAKKMIADAEELRNQIFADAQKEAAAIRMAAETEAAEFKAQAKADGHAAGQAEGYEAGLQMAREEMRAAIDGANEKAERTLAAVHDEMRTSMVLAERQIVELVLAIVEKVLPQHFIDAPQIILPLVRRALDKMKDQNDIVIRVAPDNYEFVIMAKNEFQAMITGNEPIQVQADPSLGPGDCIVETLNGSVDVRLATQLELIKKSIQEVMG